MFNQKYYCLYVILLAVMVAFCATAFLGEPARRSMMDEWGPVESAGVLLYVGVVIVLVEYSQHDRPFFMHTVVILTMMSARELDFQTAFTSKNFLNKTFYRHSAEGFTQEQMSAMIVVGIVGLIAISYLCYLPRLIANLKRGKPFAFSIAAAILMIPASVLLDGAYRVLHEEWGLPLALSVKHFISSLEECLETGIPMMMLLALLQYRIITFGSGGPGPEGSR